MLRRRYVVVVSRRSRVGIGIELENLASDRIDAFGRDLISRERTAGETGSRSCGIIDLDQVSRRIERLRKIPGALARGRNVAREQSAVRRKRHVPVDEKESPVLAAVVRQPQRTTEGEAGIVLNVLG